ncbi:MAG TPA: hypothetical protein VFR37_05915, partial [Longimicrobium sp.]|nr:hypothetical protein [Longimicrobium sp.]
YVARAAAHARARVRELTGFARATPAGSIHVDLAWVTEDELALFDIPGWERPGRRRYIEHGARPREWLRTSSIRWRMIVGEAAPGSYHGIVAEDLDQIPPDARYAMVSLQAGPSRLARFESMERLWAGGCTDDALRYVGRLPALRELCTFDDSRLSSLEPLAGRAGLELAHIHAGDELSDVRPLAEIPALRHLRLDAPRMHDLSGAGRFTQLNTLNLTPAPVVDSLAPLAALTNLRHLSVWMEEVREGGLAPLARLQELRSLGVSPDAFDLEEFARLAVALPGTDGPHRSPFLPPDDPAYYRIRCRHCGRRDLRLPLGTPRRGFCPACSPDAIRRHVARWEILLSAAAAG